MIMFFCAAWFGWIEHWTIDKAIRLQINSYFRCFWFFVWLVVDDHVLTQIYLHSRCYKSFYNILETRLYLNTLKWLFSAYSVSHWVLILCYFSIFQRGYYSNLHEYYLWWLEESFSLEKSTPDFNMAARLFLLWDWCSLLLAIWTYTPNSTSLVCSPQLIINRFQ
jgi:hypothetical protein